MTPDMPPLLALPPTEVVLMAVVAVTTAAAFIGWLVTMIYYKKMLAYVKVAQFWWFFWLKEAHDADLDPDVDHAEWAEENSPAGMTIEDQYDAIKNVEAENVHPMYMEPVIND